MRVEGAPDCGNSPKGEFIRRLAIEISGGRIDASAYSESAEVCAPGGRDVGLAGAGSLLGESPAEAVFIHRVVSHGRAGAVELTVTAADGSRLDVCLVFEFASLKADRVRYVRAYA